MLSDRAVDVWASVAAAHQGSGPISVAAVCRAAMATLAIDGASVTAISGLVAREPLFATGSLSALLEELQFTTGEGPAVDDFRLGTPVLIPELESAAQRWPGFVSAALAAGVRALFVLPLQVGAVRVGVLSLYRELPGPLTADGLSDALVLADIALQLVLDVSAGITGSPDYHPMSGLSDGRASVYQATGMISVQLGVGVDEAFVRLRAYAFANGSALADVAVEVVNRRLRLDSG